MSLRISAARWLLRLSSIIQKLPILFMKPDDLVKFSHQSYSRPGNVEGWGEDSLIDSGLAADESDLLSDISEKSEQLLLLDEGGDRDAIPLAKMGFEVTGVDYVAEMVELAKENAAQSGGQIKGLVQEISKLDVPTESYDVIWKFRSMYSCVPTRERRVALVKRIKRALKPGGIFIYQYYRDHRPRQTKRASFFKRMIAICTFGNLKYEEGDILHLNIEFVHKFRTDDELISEMEEGDLVETHVQTDISPIKGGAVCRIAPVLP